MTVGELRKLLEPCPDDMEVARESIDFECDFELANSEDICIKRVVPFVRDDVMIGWLYPENVSGRAHDSTSECEIVVIGY